MFTLETDRLLIRNWTSKDYDDAHEYASDPEVSKLMVWGPNTLKETRAFVDTAIDTAREKPRRAYELAIELKESSKVIGGIGLAINDPQYSLGMLGYALNSKYWRQGFAYEASCQMLKFGFKDLDLHRIYATTDTKNIGSQRVLEKCGLRKEGHMVEDVHIKGKWRDSFFYAILKREWFDSNLL